MLTQSRSGYGQQDLMSNPLVKAELSKRDAGTQNYPKGVNAAWYGSAVAAIESRELAMSAAGNSGEFAAINPAQHLGYFFDKDGYTVNHYNDGGATEKNWRASFRLSGIGRSGQMSKTVLTGISRSGADQVSYDYGRYIISYDNRKEGMEQRFIVKERPAGVRPLEVAIAIGGDLVARLAAGDQLQLRKAGQASKAELVYDQFKVWDRNGKILPAHMRLDGAHRLVLSVDDRAAEYPLTIDPLNHTPSATFGLTGVFGSSVNEISTPVLGGYSVSGAGDLNGDGAGDIIIGAPLFTTLNLTGGVGTISGLARGAAFIYYGVIAGTPSATPSQVLQPAAAGAASLFGFSVSTAGDLDGDGKADLIVGAPGTSLVVLVVGFPTAVSTGSVFVYKGSAMGTDVNTIPAPAAQLSLTSSEISALSINPLYGFSVSDAGDVNGDGKGDIIIGTPGWGAGLGRVDIYHGANTAAGVVSATTPNRIITGSLTATLFGFSVSGAGDVNKDTYSDVIVGAPGVLASILQGHAYVFHGSATGIPSSVTTNLSATGTLGTTLSAPGITLLGTLFGFSVSTAGDVNNDGAGDVIVGEPLRLDGISAAGAAYIFYGTAAATGIGSGTPVTLRSPRSPTILGTSVPLNLLFGFSVAKAGNVKGDAAGDVVVGEPGSTVISNSTLLSGTLSTLGLTLNTSTRVLSGAVYLFTGATGTGIVTNQAPSWTLTNSDVVTAGDMLGSSVHYGGDINKDGFDDFLIGSPSGGIDLGVNLTTRATNVSLSVGNGLITTGNTNAGSSYAYFGFSSALPVTLLSFTGTAVEAGVQLNWTTSLEVNSDHFEVERSTDNVHFTHIGDVTAAHNSTMPVNYGLLDGAPASGTNYYRLKEVDLDGTAVYSKVIAVDFNAGSIRMIGVYPNPARGSFHLLLKNMPSGRYEMSVLNAIGQRMMTRVVQVSSSASYNETVDLTPGMAQGSYMVQVVDGQNRVYVTKLVVN